MCGRLHPKFFFSGNVGYSVHHAIIRTKDSDVLNTLVKHTSIVQGIGPATAALLNNAGIYSVLDFLVRPTACCHSLVKSVSSSE